MTSIFTDQCPTYKTTKILLEEKIIMKTVEGWNVSVEEVKWTDLHVFFQFDP